MLSRSALARVLQSLLTAELGAARGRAGRHNGLPGHLPSVWPESLRIAHGGSLTLGCDSLESLWLAAAANEMFNLYEVEREDDLLSAPSFGAWLDHIEAAWRDGVSRITFTTSGSTGLPKRCPHSVSYLKSEIRHLADLFAGRSRIVALAPAHHIYGFLFTAMLPDRLGLEVLAVEGLSPGPLARSLRPGDLIVSFPERWQWLARSLPSWPVNVAGVVSTAPCPRELLAVLEHAGVNRMVEIYGSSETAGVAVREWPQEAYHLMPQWQLVELIDPDQPELFHISGLRVELMDRITLCKDQTFRLAGRRDGVVQVGGTNVQPARVAAQLQGCPGVGAAVVRLMRPDEGTRLKAFIVPASDVDQDSLRADLEVWIEAHLATAERPRALMFGASLPMNALGKSTDW